MKNDIEQVKKDLEFIRLVHLIDDDLTYTRLYYRKMAGVELSFKKRRHRRIQRLLENQLKKIKSRGVIRNGRNRKAYKGNTKYR